MEVRPYMKYEFDQAVFTFTIGENQLDGFTRHKPVLQTLTLCHTSHTDVVQKQDAGNEITIIGTCVDALGELDEARILDLLLQTCPDGIEAVYRKSDRLAGKFVVCVQNQDGRYLFGDATGALSIYYAAGEEAPIFLASWDNIIAKTLGFSPDPVLLEVRNSSDYSQPMPYDVSVYQQIKALLPNHYLDLDRRRPVRVPFLPCSPRSAEQAAAESAPLIRNIISAYRTRYSLICPLTGGYDSRVVFAFLREQCPDLRCYTFRHTNFTETHADLIVPAQICKELGVEYMTIPDEHADETFLSDFQAVAGPYGGKDMLDLAYTYIRHNRGFTMVNGDIIGQIGKSVLGNALPVCLATPKYLQCKVHNFSSHCSELLKAHLQDLKSCGERPLIYDLFAMESRLGRWAAQSGTWLGLCGMSALNIFNCREIIRLWSSVDRKQRTKAIIHKELYGLSDRRLLKYPINPTSRWKHVKEFPILYWAATYVKFYLQKRQFRARTKQ